MSTPVAVLLCALGVTGAIPDARAAEVLDAYTVSREAWARPTVPGQPIDVATMMLGDDVSDVLTIMVVRDASGETPTAADLARFCTEVVGSYFPAQRTVAETAVARAALTVEPPPIAAPAVDIVAREFGRERAVTDLPGSEAIPAEFEFVARDYQFRSS